MKPDVHLCEHHAAAELSALCIHPVNVLIWRDGPIAAVAECPTCGAGALLEMLDWSGDRRVRIYAFAGLDSEAMALYRRNTSKGSCDVNRFALESQALLSLAGAPERLIALDTDGNRVVASAPAPEGLVVPDEEWASRLPEAHDARWFRALGLDKATRHG